MAAGKPDEARKLANDAAAVKASHGWWDGHAGQGFGRSETSR
jgi:hypothetical protein